MQIKEFSVLSDDQAAMALDIMRGFKGMAPEDRRGFLEDIADPFVRGAVRGLCMREGLLRKEGFIEDWKCSKSSPGRESSIRIIGE